MKYLIRSVKYFFYFAIVVTLILTILSVAGIVEADIDLMFKDGIQSVYQIAGMLLVISAVYPFFGFTKKETVIPGEYGEIRGGIIDYMEDKGYKLIKEDGENMVFRMRNVVNRVSRMLEDDVTLTRSFSGFTMEGLRRDIVRLSYGLEYKFRNDAEL